jgi:transposase
LRPTWTIWSATQPMKAGQLISPGATVLSSEASLSVPRRAATTAARWECLPSETPSATHMTRYRPSGVRR